jgi:TonB family protein
MAFSSKQVPVWLAAAVIACSLLVSTPSISQQASVSKRRVVERTAPGYPTLARNMGLQGTVRVDAVVSPDGSVKMVDVKGGHPVLVQAAATAVRKWRWEPAARESRESVEVKFLPE